MDRVRSDLRLPILASLRGTIPGRISRSDGSADKGLHSDINLLILLVAIYAICVAIFIVLVRENPSVLLAEAAALAPTGVFIFFSGNLWLALLVLVLITVLRHGDRVRRFSDVIFCILICSAFVSVFVLAKASLIHAVPFYADVFWERLDRALHFDFRPVELAQKLSQFISPQATTATYVTAWLLPGMFLPVFVAALDDDPARKRRFVVLYLFAWIVLGNVIALLGMSVGPVYFDRLLGKTVFNDLPQMMISSGLDQTIVPQMQERLWALYLGGEGDSGSGISAFPSVHVGMASVVGLYLFERSRWLALVAVPLVLWYQFLSVYTGWHYAVDGYFSIIAVAAFWWFLLSRERRLQG